jgi:hypothetical protein
MTLGRIKAEVQMMETDVLMLLAFPLALHWLDRRPAAAGAVLGFALNIKYLTVAALPYLLIRRRWTAAAAFVVATAGFALLPALKVGVRTDLRYLGVAGGGLTEYLGVKTADGQRARVPHLTDMLSVSVTSGIARAVRNRHPGAALPLAAAVAAAAVGLAGWWYRRSRLPFLAWPPAAAQQVPPYRALVALEWVGVVAVALCFSPDTNMRHLILCLLVNAAAAVLLLAPAPGVPRLPLLIAVVVEVLTFDTGNVWSRSANVAWFRVGGHGWWLLVVYGTLLWTGLRHVIAGTSGGKAAGGAAAGAGGTEGTPTSPMASTTSPSGVRSAGA